MRSAKRLDSRFAHIFLSDDRGEQLEADADGAACATQGGAVRRSIRVGRQVPRPQPSSQMNRGKAWRLSSAAYFHEQLNAVAMGQWAGPVRSAYGVHLVLVTDRTEGRTAAARQKRARR